MSSEFLRFLRHAVRGHEWERVVYDTTIPAGIFDETERPFFWERTVCFCGVALGVLQPVTSPARSPESPAPE